MKRWELIAVGAGVAGLTAGIYGARNGLETLIVEKKIPGDATLEAPLIENYPGFPQDISGVDLTKGLVEHAERMGAEIHQLEEATELDLKAREKEINTKEEVYTTPALISASRSRYRTLGVHGEEEIRGRGVSYCAVSDGAFLKGMRMVAVGGGNSAAVSTIHLSNLASDVKLAHRRNQLRAEEALLKDIRSRGVDILWNTEVYYKAHRIKW